MDPHELLEAEVDIGESERADLRRLQHAYAQLVETNRALAREAFAKRSSAAAISLTRREEHAEALQADLAHAHSLNASLEQRLAAPRHRFVDRLHDQLVQRPLPRGLMGWLGSKLRAGAPSASAVPPDSAPFERNAAYAPTPDNRPVPLDVAPLPLARDGVPQMAFGERAALEGVLSQVQPKLALEIGTAEGGSLRRIAAHSAEVHSIDIDHDPVREGDPLPDHVTLHTGSSAQLLSRLLDSFAQAGRLVDFALVDGDHSFEGVAADLRALLTSPVTSRTVILVHDSMNPEVRAGIQSVGFDDYENVVYHELDFVPGYTYAEGAVRDSTWGGIALVMTDLRRSAAYAESTGQSLYQSPSSVSRP